MICLASSLPPSVNQTQDKVCSPSNKMHRRRGGCESATEPGARFVCGELVSPCVPPCVPPIPPLCPLVSPVLRINLNFISPSHAAGPHRHVLATLPPVQRPKASALANFRLPESYKGSALKVNVHQRHFHSRLFANETHFTM